MERTTETIIQLIADEVCGKDFTSPHDGFTDHFLVDMFSVCNAHDVTHIVGSALLDKKLLDDKSMVGQYRNSVCSAVYRYEKFSYVSEQVCTILEKAEIPYIPLKGSVISDIYPQPWMRTGCDIDILVHKCDLSRAIDALLSLPGYRMKEKSKHDVSFLSADNVCIELHFRLIEDSRSGAASKVLKKVWKYAAPADNGKYRYVLDDAMFYFYHVAHMAKHFVQGGCGLRPFLDLWLMENSRNYNTEETRKLLKLGKLTEFAEEVSYLSKVWFGTKEHSETTLLMQSYIMDGGNFGTHESRMAAGHRRYGGRTNFIFKKIFLPYSDLKRHYPVLKKYGFLLPFYEIYRLWLLLFGKKKDFRKKYVSNLRNVSDEHIDNINTLFEKIGL